MKTREIIADRDRAAIAEVLTARGFNFEYIDTSVTDAGISHYTYINGIKVRVSDHSVTNIHRMTTEFHISISKLNQGVDNLEAVIFPERFATIATPQTREVTVSKKVVTLDGKPVVKRIARSGRELHFHREVKRAMTIEVKTRVRI